MNAAAAVVTAIVAVIAGSFAGYQVLLAARDRRQRDRPFVVVDLAEGGRGYTNTIELVVANAGLTVARDVMLEFHSLPQVEPAHLPSLPDQIGDGIPTLAPGREHRFIAGDIIRTLGGTRISVEGSARVVVCCRDDKQREYRDEYELDFDIFGRRVTDSDDGLWDIAKNLEKIERALGRFDARRR